MRNSAFSRNNLSNLNFLPFSFLPVCIDIYIPMSNKRIYYAKNCRGYRHFIHAYLFCQYDIKK